jgi:hypothetical protein
VPDAHVQLGRHVCSVKSERADERVRERERVHVSVSVSVHMCAWVCVRVGRRWWARVRQEMTRDVGEGDWGNGQVEVFSV